MIPNHLEMEVRVSIKSTHNIKLIASETDKRVKLLRMLHHINCAHAEIIMSLKEPC